MCIRDRTILDHERHAVRRLEIGFVPTWERPASIRCLELCRCHDLLDAIDCVDRAVETTKIIVEDAREVDFDPRGANRQRSVDSERRAPGFLVTFHGCRLFNPI